MFPSIYKPYTGGEVNLLDRMKKIGPHTVDLWNSKAKPIIFTGG
jgi:hypothetical protein